MQKKNLNVGDVVIAFHPREFGVIREGRITKIGRKYAHIDFGPIRGGVFRVPFDYVRDFASDFGSLTI
jgi:hypothetical protein